MGKPQREFLRRQQLEAIKKQLNGGGSDVVSGYRERVVKAGMPDAVRLEVEREIDRLERTSEQNPEYGWIRTYLDWMMDIPWNVRSDDNFDLAEARRILDEDHTGLSDVKDRIIEFLAVRKLRKERGLEVLGGRGSGASITPVGPPGVGPTSASGRSCPPPRPTCRRRFRLRCWTGWSSSAWTATPRRRRSPSRATTCSAARSSRPACTPRRSASRTTRSCR